MPVGQFFEVIKQQSVREWSLDRNPQDINAKAYALSPDYNLEDMTKAYQWIQRKQNVRFIVSQKVG
jgi:hypothetical protein